MRLYEIEMQTPLGQRPGLLSVYQEQEALHGYLTVLRHTEPYSGTVDADGNCRFSGKLVTLTRTLPYVATGKFSGEYVAIRLAAVFENRKETFAITGKLRGEEGDRL